jgi:hypothetical protein
MGTSQQDVNMIGSIGRKILRQIFGRLHAKGVRIIANNEEIAIDS